MKRNLLQCRWHLREGEVPLEEPPFSNFLFSTRAARSILHVRLRENIAQSTRLLSSPQLEKSKNTYGQTRGIINS